MVKLLLQSISKCDILIKQSTLLTIYNKPKQMSSRKIIQILRSKGMKGEMNVNSHIKYSRIIICYFSDGSICPVASEIQSV